MGRKISRKKNLQSKYKSKKFFLKGGMGTATLTPGKAGITYGATVTSGARAAQSQFSDTMKEYDTIRRMIEDLKYDGNNLASYNERKSKYRTIKTEGIEWLIQHKEQSKSKNLRARGLRLEGKMQGAILAMQKFSNQSSIGSITQGQKKTEVHRLVMLCRRRGVEAITDQLQKDLTKIKTTLASIPN